MSVANALHDVPSARATRLESLLCAMIARAARTYFNGLNQERLRCPSLIVSTTGAVAVLISIR
eukprot:4409056-Amphidinium_carterae.1